MIRAFLLSAAVAVGVLAEMFSHPMAPAGFDTDAQLHIRLLDAKTVRFDRPDDTKFAEISGLAYDGTKQRLYALSDRGILHTLKLTLEGKTLAGLDLLESRPLANAKGKPFKKSKRDAEGMVLTKQGLLVSFERKPRIVLFNKKGKKTKRVKIDKRLRDIDNYRGKNKALEAVAYHPRYGVITAPERPLRSNPKTEHTLYADGREWRFKAHASVTALEAMPGDNLLVLERSFDALSFRHVITLTEVVLEDCENTLCRSRVLARFDSSEGWELDNFEGLTRIRDNIYLMVSDDNDSFLQKTVLVLFEVVSQ